MELQGGCYGGVTGEWVRDHTMSYNPETGIFTTSGNKWYDDGYLAGCTVTWYCYYIE